jgi:hypothetical protein
MAKGVAVGNYRGGTKKKDRVFTQKVNYPN